MARKTCTPFCDTRKNCPKHHDLLLAVIGCSDMRNKRGNLDEFEDTVKSFLKKGWKREDEIPDPVKNYRFPLLHWAGVLGKCKAMEWMLKNGFSATVRCSDTQETALHRCVLCLHYAKIRRLSEKIRQMVDMLKDCLPLQDKALQTPLHAAAIKLISGANSDFYEECLTQMVKKAVENPGKTADILNAQDQHGNTCLHYLAQNEIGFVALRAIVEGKGDMAIKNKKKLTPLDVANNKGSTRIIKILTAAAKKTQNSSRYDSNVYTTESPPESPVNDEDVDQTPQDDPSHIEDPESLPEDSSPKSMDTSALECLEECSFDTNTSADADVEASDGAPDVTEDQVTDIAPDCTMDDAPSGVTDDSCSDAHNAPSADEVPPGVTGDSCSGTDNAPSADEVPPGVTGDSCSGTDHAPSADEVPPGVTDDSCSDTHNAPSADVVPSGVTGDSCSGTDNAPSADEVPSGATEDAPTPPPSNSDTAEEVPPASYDELPCDDPDEDEPMSDDGDAIPSDEDDLPGHAECGHTGVQTAAIDPYSCIVHIKQEMMTEPFEIQPCEKCRQEAADASTSSSSSSELFQAITSNNLANSVVNLLKGAGLLANLTDMAEKTRTDDERLLTNKLEMVKDTNSELESGEKVIEEKNSNIEEKKRKIQEMMAEVEELKQEVKEKTDERETLFRKRKRLNDECNTLQTKLHCCDSLLRVVPKVN